MSLNVGELVGYLRLDMGDFETGMAKGTALADKLDGRDVDVKVKATTAVAEAKLAAYGLLGKAAPIGRMASHPLFRALRADKLTLAALEATLRLYEDEERLTETIPVLHMLSRSKDELTRRARRLRNALAKIPGLETRLADGVGYTGGGALPMVPLPTKLVQVRAGAMSVEELASALRRHNPPVMGILADGWLALDVRTVREDEMRAIVQAVQDICGERT